MFITYFSQASRFRRQYNFPFQIGKLPISEGMSNYWRPSDNRPMTGGLEPERDQLLSTQKLNRLGGIIQGERIPVERIEICNNSTDVLEVLLDRYQVEDGEVDPDWRRFNGALKRAFMCNIYNERNVDL